jgi:hypothetical protein
VVLNWLINLGYVGVDPPDSPNLLSSTLMLTEKGWLEGRLGQRSRRRREEKISRKALHDAARSFVRGNRASTDRLLNAAERYRRTMTER